MVSSSNTLMVVGFLRKELILRSTCLRYSSLDQASQYSRLPQVLDTRKILGLSSERQVSSNARRKEQQVRPREYLLKRAKGRPGRIRI